MLKIYYADISRLDLEAVGPLSDYRKKKLETIKPLLKRRQGIGAELLLNEAVRRSWPELKLPMEIETEEKGKPFCRDLPGHFSLSHSGDYAVCAVSSQPLGVDIQKKVEYRADVSERCFSPDEREQLFKAADRDVEFTRIWALKESYLKASGIGIFTPLSSFSTVEKIQKAACGFWHTEIGEYQLAVCVRGVSASCPDEFEEIFIKTRV